MYIKNKQGDYLRLDNAETLGVQNDNGTWRITKNPATTDPFKSAAYSSEEAARDALDEILDILGRIKDPS